MMVGLGRLELPTPRLSSVCSNQLSYRPISAVLFRLYFVIFSLASLTYLLGMLRSTLSKLPSSKQKTPRFINPEQGALYFS